MICRNAFVFRRDLHIYCADIVLMWQSFFSLPFFLLKITSNLYLNFINDIIKPCMITMLNAVIAIMCFLCMFCCHLFFILKVKLYGPAHLVLTSNTCLVTTSDWILLLHTIHHSPQYIGHWLIKIFLELDDIGKLISLIFAFISMQKLRVDRYVFFRVVANTDYYS